MGTPLAARSSVTNAFAQGMFPVLATSKMTSRQPPDLLAMGMNQPDGKGSEGLQCHERQIGLDQIEEIFSCEVSDEALEAAAGIGNKIAGQYTLFYCTALDLCPGP
jgi:hypothetical protein